MRYCVQKVWATYLHVPMILVCVLWLKPDKLAALNMTAADVTAALTEQNAQVAAGTVGATPQMKGQTFEYSCIG
jgi:hypothetical protein